MTKNSYFDFKKSDFWQL